MVDSANKIPGEKWSNALTARERQIAVLVAGGFSNKAVARELGLSNGTVKTHMHSIFQKLGANSRFQLIIQVGIANRVAA